MKKEKVESLVKELMKRLCMDNGELEGIMKDYTANFFIPRVSNAPISLSHETDVKFPEEEIDENFPESARLVYFPWEDVIGSMMEHHEEIHFLDEVCPDCGNKLLNIDFWSPTCTWVGLCGRSGPMKLCLHCPRQIDFELHIMN